MTPPFSIQEILDRIAAALQLDGQALIRAGLRVIAIWLLAWVSLWLIKVAARRIVQAVDDGDDSVVTLREKRGQTVSQLLKSVGRVVVVTVAILLTLNVFVNIGPLLAGAGILGLAVSFGAQSLVKDIISGFFVLVENQFAVGDVIEAGGKSGVVEKMTMRVVILRDLHGVMHVIPNGEIKMVSNMTRGWSRAVLDLAVAYAEDVDRAIAVLRDEIERLVRDEEWAPLLDGVPEVWGVESLGDSSVVIRLVARTQPGSHWGIARELRRRIKRRFQEEGIVIPFPQRTVHVHADGAGTLPSDGQGVASAAAARE